MYVFGKCQREITKLLIGARIVSELMRFPSLLQFIISITSIDYLHLCSLKLSHLCLWLSLNQPCALGIFSSSAGPNPILYCGDGGRVL